MITAVARETDYSLQKHENVLTEIVLSVEGRVLILKRQSLTTMKEGLLDW
jgi:hypothetical protein